MAKKRRISVFVLGGMMILGGISGLFWNEWRSASRIATLIEGQDQAISARNGKVAQNHDGKLVHITATPMINGQAVDPVFGLARDAVALQRRVEMFQWRERKEGGDSDREATYERVWSQGRINSERFERQMGHVNPPFPNLASERFYPPSVGLGDYTLTSSILSEVENLNDVAPPPTPIAMIEGLTLKVDGNYLATGSVSSPQIGDIRVAWRDAPLGVYSVLARQNGIELDRWQASNDGEIAMIEAGEFSMEEMFDQAYGDNSKITWAARGGFTIAIFMGMTILLRKLARMIPLVGKVAAKFAKPLAMALTAVTALLTIAAGWLIFRPIFSLTLIVIAAAIFFGIRWMRAGEGDDDIVQSDQPPPPPSNGPPSAPPPLPSS